jgi:hypothetical protein
LYRLPRSVCNLDQHSPKLENYQSFGLDNYTQYLFLIG